MDTMAMESYARLYMQKQGKDTFRFPSVGLLGWYRSGVNGVHNFLTGVFSLERRTSWRNTFIFLSFTRSFGLCHRAACARCELVISALGSLKFIIECR